MPAAGGEDRASSPVGAAPISAGRVGRPHGLDGSFYVTGARPRLLGIGTSVGLGELRTRVIDRRGTEQRPIVRVASVEDRAAAEALRGRELSVERADAPALQENEWWAGDLEGCQVFDGDRRLGVVARLVELPSCEALELRGGARGRAQPLLIPMVRGAIRSVDVRGRRIEVDMRFVEE